MKKNLELLSIISLCICLGMALVPEKLTSEKYKQIMEDYNNVHYYIINERLVTDEMMAHFQHYSGHEMVKLFQCNPSAHLPFCQKDLTLYLVMNTIKIQFNGHEEHPDDIKKWIQYRINEHPDRMHSVQQLQEQARQKFQVFCYIDREGQEMTKKQKIFLALAKSMHYLHFCYMDVEIAKELNLKEGDVALVRRNMTITIEGVTRNIHEDKKEAYYQAWMGYLIKQFASDFRIEGKNKFQNKVILECDRSLECEDELSELLAWEKVWRDQNPQLNFGIHINNGISGMGALNDEEEYDYPGFKYVIRTPVESYKYDANGHLVRIIDTTHEQYIGFGIRVNEFSIKKLLELKDKNKLRFTQSKTSTSIIPLELEEIAKYKHLATNQPPQNRQEL